MWAEGRNHLSLALQTQAKTACNFCKLRSHGDGWGGRIATKAGRKFRKRYLEFVELPENMEAWMHAFLKNI